jgi:hypothetical protein
MLSLGLTHLLNTVDRVYIVDGFANWDPEVGLLLGMRVIC